MHHGLPFGDRLMCYPIRNHIPDAWDSRAKRGRYTSLACKYLARNGKRLFGVAALRDEKFSGVSPPPCLILQQISIKQSLDAVRNRGLGFRQPSESGPDASVEPHLF